MTASNTQVCLVVGGSRGIGRQIAIDLSRTGFAVAVAAKTRSNAHDPDSDFPPDPNSPKSTVDTVVREIKSAGGLAIPITVDTRDHQSIQEMVQTTVDRLGRLDVLVYNAGAVWWAPVQNTPTKRFMLMQQVNVQGLYVAVQAALPHFAAAGWKGRIVVISPPIYSRFFRGKTAYSIGKVGMSVLTKGLAMDWIRENKDQMAITSLWPAVSVESAATGNMKEADEMLRKPTIMSDAVLAILEAPPQRVNGELLLDEDFLREFKGKTDFTEYSVIPGSHPPRIMPAILPDLSVAEQDEEGMRIDSSKRGARL